MNRGMQRVRRTALGLACGLGAVLLGAAGPAPAPAAPAPEMTVQSRRPPVLQPLFGRQQFSRQSMDRQGEYVAERVHRDIAAVFPGEDMLGSGSSITH